MAIRVQTDAGSDYYESASSWTVEDRRLVVRSESTGAVAEYNQNCWVAVGMTTTEEK